MEPVEKSSAPHVLGYGAQRFSRTTRRWLALVAITLVIGRVSWIPLKPYWDQAVHLRNQYRISHQVLPGGTVIFTEDPVRIAALLKDPAYQAERASWGIDYGVTCPDACERRPTVDFFDARFFNATTAAKIMIGGTFGFRRTSAGNQEWIVRLDAVAPFPASNGRRKINLCQASFRPVGWVPGSRGNSVTYMSRQMLLAQPLDLLTLFAPQPDSANSSQIIVPYELNGRPGTMIGTLQDDGYVMFRNGSGPANVVQWDVR